MATCLMMHDYMFLIAPTAVRNVSAVTKNSESVKVSWDSPEFPNGRVSAYTLGYK